MASGASGARPSANTMSFRCRRALWVLVMTVGMQVLHLNAALPFPGGTSPDTPSPFASLVLRLFRTFFRHTSSAAHMHATLYAMILHDLFMLLFSVSEKHRTLCSPLDPDGNSSCSPARVTLTAVGGRSAGGEVQVAWEARGEARDDHVQVYVGRHLSGVANCKRYTGPGCDAALPDGQMGR